MEENYPPPLSVMLTRSAESILDMCMRLSNISKLATAQLKLLNEGKAMEHEMRTELEHLYAEWLETLVYESGFYNTVENYNLLDGRHVLSSYSMQIYIELSRVHYLLEAEAWQREHLHLLKLTTVPETPGQYNLLWSLSMTRSRHWVEDGWDNWTKPVARYTQSEVCAAISHLCECLLDFPSADEVAMEDYSRFLYLLMTHTCRFFCVESSGDMLNVEDMRAPSKTEGLYYFNRNFAMFCTAYFGAALKRLHYYNLFWAKRMTHVELQFNVKAGGESVKHWFTTVVCRSLGEEGFDDCYTLVMDESYECPGDDFW